VGPGFSFLSTGQLRRREETAFLRKNPGIRRVDGDVIPAASATTMFHHRRGRSASKITVGHAWNAGWQQDQFERSPRG
jgi:hypothetical protein